MSRDDADAHSDTLAAPASTVSLGKPAPRMSPPRELPVVDPANYERGAEVGRGGLGRVLRAEDRLLATTTGVETRVWDVTRPVSWRVSGNMAAGIAFTPAGDLLAQDAKVMSIWNQGIPHDGPALRRWLDSATNLAVDEQGRLVVRAP